MKIFGPYKGSKANGGVLAMFAQAQMVPAFNDFAFDNPVGTKGVVKTEFGFMNPFSNLTEVLGDSKKSVAKFEKKICGVPVLTVTYENVNFVKDK